MIDRIPISRKEEPIHGSLVAIPLCPGPRSALHRRTRHADPADSDRSPLCGGAFDSDGDAGVPDADGPDFDGPDADGGPLHEAAADPETPDTGLHLFTVRGVVAFLVLFGWGGLWLHQVGLPGFLAVFLAIPIGFAGMVGIALAVRQALRLQYDGTLDLRNALGRTGTVYLTVPPAAPPRQGHPHRAGAADGI